MPRTNKSMELTDTIRARVEESGWFYYELADELGVSEMTLRRWLRSGCDEEHYKRIMAALDGLQGTFGN